ncbi:phage tail terminator family protein [Pelosinus propionicus]|uniref:Uncharacterized protein n=1 Tax=Pelosinus propionicus DSM 13327 TaxID=1123291 RepID=A0A1I4QC38_9FIRM|nr:hypothetical protein [Pelosinus propionicus]SFM37607.1 hypothetical protein SAMN04490355_10945 [Pelosinus propionicus DSM 13327]
MAVEINLAFLVSGLADKLAGLFPGIHIFANPSQQFMNSVLDSEGKHLPCFFIIPRPGATIKKGIDRWYWQPLYELVYLTDLYTDTQQYEFQDVAQLLDESLETFIANGAIIRTYNRKWTIELQALHYMIDIKQFVQLPKEEVVKMQTYTLTEEVKLDG